MSQQTLLAFGCETSSATCIRALSIFTNEEAHERRAAQAEIQIENDKCGPETHGENSCGTRLITFILARRSTSRESPNPSACHTTSGSSRQQQKLCDARKPCSGVPKRRRCPRLAQEVVSSVSHCDLAATNYDNEFITTSWQQDLSLMSGEKTRTHQNTNQNVCGDIWG